MMKIHLKRGWWKPWTWSARAWAFTIALSLLSSPFVTRWFCLWQIPNVVLPFDVENVSEPDLPKDQNAYDVYAKVMRLLANGSANIGDSEKETSASDQVNGREELIRRMTIHNEQALAEYLRAGQMGHAVGPSLNTANFWTDLSFYAQLRQLVHNYNSLGISFEDAGEIERAWACHKANFQCSIHAEQTHLMICGAFAIQIRYISAEGITHWASNPSITAERLRAARSEVAQEYSRRAPYSAFANGEYLYARNTLKRIEAVEFMFPESVVQYLLPAGPGGSSSSALSLMGARGLLWCCAQPELTLRMSRQILLNNTQELDKPLHLRRHSIERAGQLIFDLDPDVRRVSGQLDAKQLVRTLESDSPILRMSRDVLYAMSSYDGARRRDNARFSALTVLMAAHEFQRTHGEFPEAIEQLVPSYLNKIPLDAMDEHGKPVNYRREPDGTAVVWSVGANGIDDRGSITAQNQYDSLDYGYPIKLNHADNSEPTNVAR